jgi:hypothetical protein
VARRNRRFEDSARTAALIQPISGTSSSGKTLLSVLREKRGRGKSEFRENLDGVVSTLRPVAPGALPPLEELQLLQSTLAFDQLATPPFETGVMWSQVRSVVAPHAEHQG